MRFKEADAYTIVKKAEPIVDDGLDYVSTGSNVSVDPDVRSGALTTPLVIIILSRDLQGYSIGSHWSEVLLVSHRLYPSSTLI